MKPTFTLDEFNLVFPRILFKSKKMRKEAILFLEEAVDFRDNPLGIYSFPRFVTPKTMAHTALFQWLQMLFGEEDRRLDLFGPRKFEDIEHFLDIKYFYKKDQLLSTYFKKASKFNRKNEEKIIQLSEDLRAWMIRQLKAY